MDKKTLNFQQAIAKMQAYLAVETIKDDFGSISVSFEEDWTGKTESYVIDTSTVDIKPRLFSLETGHVIENFEFPETLSEDIVAELEKVVVPEFQKAHDTLMNNIKEHATPSDPVVTEPKEPVVVEDPESLGLY